MIILPENPYACEECGQPLEVDNSEMYEGRCTNADCRLNGMEIAILDPGTGSKT